MPNPYQLSDEEIDDMSNDDIEDAREELSREYFSGEGPRHHHLTAREKAQIRDTLIRLHKALTNRFATPKRIER